MNKKSGMSKKNGVTVEFDGKKFQIAQPVPKCCESGCPGCELYVYKKENNIPMHENRMKHFQDLARLRQEDSED